MMFSTPESSHEHSLTILNALQEYDEFMESITNLVDLGCGSGLDVEWWATRTTREDNPQPLNINCVGVDIANAIPAAKKYTNVTYQRTNFEEIVHTPKDHKFDVLWCHDAFQYCVNPVNTLIKWRDISSDGSMLVLTVPQLSMINNRPAFNQLSGEYFHYSLVSLMHMLAVTGWDCNSGYFRKLPDSPWVTAIVYKSDIGPMDPRTTTWYDLADSGLLPESAVKSIIAHGYLKQEDLLIEWLDHSLIWMGKQ